MPQCAPSRAHYYFLSAAGMEAVEEAELCERVVPTNGHRVPWLSRAAISVPTRSSVRTRSRRDEDDDEKPRLLQGGSRRDLTERRLSRASQQLADGGMIAA